MLSPLVCHTECNPDESAPGLATLGGRVRDGKQQSTAKHRKVGLPISFRRQAVICRCKNRGNPSGKVWAAVLDASTVQRWERREAMPVHRHLHDRQGSVFAFRSELDRWWASRGQRLTLEAPGDSVPAQPTSADAPATLAVTPLAVPPRTARRWLWLGVAAATTLLAAALAGLAQRSEYLWHSPLAEARFVPLDFTGTEQAAAISRDGRRVTS